MDSRQDAPEVKYETPDVKDLGPLSDVTLEPKTVGGADGFTFLGQSIGST